MSSMRFSAGFASAVVISTTLWPGCTLAAETERMPVSQVKAGFPLEQARRFEQQASVRSILKAGDLALYWNVHVARTMPTAVLPRVKPTLALEERRCPAVGGIAAETKLGTLALDEFLAHPHSYAQGFVVVHSGNVLFERYPGMHDWQSHLWASNAKPTVSLLVDLLIESGMVDDQRTFGHYLADFRDTAWADIRILDLLDMTPGLNTAENAHTRSDPDSIALRLFLAELGEPRPATGELETVRDLLKTAHKLREPGTGFEYSSPVTEALVLLTEAVSDRRWSDLFFERVWSKMYVEGPLQVHLTPDGLAAAHGVVSSRLRDMARFGMLYTPSWHKVAAEQIVSESILARIRSGARSFSARGEGADRILGNSRQWDAVYADGDLYKGGMMGQGLYVSPDRDLVIAYFSTTPDGGSIRQFMRPLARHLKNGLCDSEI